MNTKRYQCSSSIQQDIWYLGVIIYEVRRHIFILFNEIGSVARNQWRSREVRCRVEVA